METLETVAAADTPAVETDVAAPETGAVDLVGMFKAELEAERGENEPAKNEPAPAPEEAAGETETVAEEAADDTAEAEPGDGPEEATDTPAINAPSGMSEADRAEFAKLPPEMQSWVSKRITEAQADYTRKTQQVAEQRKAFDAGLETVKAKLAEYDGILSQFTAPVLVPPDPSLRQTDPMAYEEQLAQFVHQKHLQDAAKAEQEKVRLEHKKIADEQAAEFARQQSEILREKAPELADPQKGAGLRKALFEYAVDSGYTPEQLSLASATDMVTLWKAQRYDALQKAKATAKVVPPPTPKTAKPGPAKAVGRPSNLTSAVRNLSQNPTREALAAAFAAEIASER
jgi:hypothetical protein